jgi:sugar lactone lactonase YvrE
VADSFNNRVLIYNYPLSDGQSAGVVLGQPDFVSNSSADLTATGLNLPQDVAEDNEGNLYVSDLVNDRVLQFKPPFTNGMAASLVIGQPNFYADDGSTTQNGLWEPSGLTFDGSGNLWVADWYNSRVLQYQPPFTTDMNASLVIGQPNFTSSSSPLTPATSSSGLSGPQFIAFDASGDLWLTYTNNRVLEFKPPFTNGMTASLVIGQINFTSNAKAVTASGFYSAAGIAFDGSGNLWVGDTFNSRVLRFEPPFSDGMNASLVLGQTDFTSDISGFATQSGISGPYGIAFDSNDNLLVTDGFNNRTMGFQPPFSNDQDANTVLGQPNFTTDTQATSATNQAGPNSVRPLF